MELFLARRNSCVHNVISACLQSGLVLNQVIYKYGESWKPKPKLKSFSGEIVIKRIVESSISKEEKTRIHHHNHHQQRQFWQNRKMVFYNCVLFVVKSNCDVLGN